MIPQLDSIEVRVLGALIEKEATTPEYYPLSANALVNACNQKSNRMPVVEYDEDTVLQAIDTLRDKGMAAVIMGNGRVHKFRQRFSELLNLGRREMAILCPLLLRGPQTLGELRDRSERIHNFEDLEAVERTMERLATFEQGPLAVKLPRHPGQKEARYAHLLSGEPVVAAGDSFREEPTPGGRDRVVNLEAELKTLRCEFAELKARLEALENALN